VLPPTTKFVFLLEENKKKTRPHKFFLLLKINEKGKKRTEGDGAGFYSTI